MALEIIRNRRAPESKMVARILVFRIVVVMVKVDGLAGFTRCVDIGAVEGLSAPDAEDASRRCSVAHDAVRRNVSRDRPVNDGVGERLADGNVLEDEQRQVGEGLILTFRTDAGTGRAGDASRRVQGLICVGAGRKRAAEQAHARALAGQTDKEAPPGAGDAGQIGVIRAAVAERACCRHDVDGFHPRSGQIEGSGVGRVADGSGQCAVDGSLRNTLGKRCGRLSRHDNRHDNRCDRGCRIGNGCACRTRGVCGGSRFNLGGQRAGRRGSQCGGRVAAQHGARAAGARAS